MQKQKTPASGNGGTETADKMAGNKLAEMTGDKARAALAAIDAANARAKADAARKAAEESARRLRERDVVVRACCGCCR